jgi:hypothetical protein
MDEIFSTLHIAVTAALTAVASVPIALRMLRSRPRAVETAIVAGLTTLGWRLAANVDALNRDGTPWISGNDALAPIVTYILLGMYAALRPPTDLRRFELLRVALAAVAFVVNVVAI